MSKLIGLTALILVVICLMYGYAYYKSTTLEGCPIYQLKANNTQCFPLFVAYCPTNSTAERHYFNAKSSTVTVTTQNCLNSCYSGYCVNPPIFDYARDYLFAYSEYLK